MFLLLITQDGEHAEHDPRWASDIHIRVTHKSELLPTVSVLRRWSRNHCRREGKASIARLDAYVVAESRLASARRRVDGEKFPTSR
jgi:hypothetical protein